MQKHTFNVLGVLLAIALLVSLCVGGVSADDWTTYMGNDGRTGYTSEEGPSTNNVLWEIDAPTPTKGQWGLNYANYDSPVVYDGKIYVSSYHIIENAPSVFCYDAKTGDEVWCQTLSGKGGARCGIAITENYVFVSGYDGKNSSLFCLNRVNGAIVGETEIIAIHNYVGLTSTPLIIDDVVWINTMQPNTTLYGYNVSDFASTQSGQKVMPYKKITLPNSTGSIYASPSTNENRDTIFVPGDGGIMAYIISTGELKTLINVSGNSASNKGISTPVYYNGNITFTLYEGYQKGKLYSINATTGNENWNVSIAAVSKSSPAVSESMIVVGTTSGISVYSLDGKLLGTHTGASADGNTPIIAGNTIYYGYYKYGTGAGVYAVDTTNTGDTTTTSYQTLWSTKQTTTGYFIEGSLAIDDGKLYYGDTIKFYAIGEPTSLFDGTVKLGTEKVDVQLNDGVYLRTVEGNSVMAAIHAAAEKGGFGYNVTYDDTTKFSLNGFAGINNNTKCSWVVYCGDSQIDINTYTLKDGDTLNIYFCKYVNGEWDKNNARPSVTITVDVPATIPETATKIFDGSVALKMGSVPIAIDENSKKNVGENTVLGVLDAAAKAGEFTYNVTYSGGAFSLTNISGYGDSNSWKLYINGTGAPTDKTIDQIIVNDGDHVAFYNGTDSSTTHYVIITAKAKPTSFTLTLKSGWNFVSVPQTLATDKNTVEIVFGSVLGDGGVLTFNGETQSWIKADKDTIIKPLEAYWVDAKAGTSVNLYYNTGDPTVVPSSKKLHEGWNAVGISADEDITVDEFLGTYNNWQAIIPWSSVSQDFTTQIYKSSSNTQTLEQGAGNWLYITAGNSLVGSL